MTLNWGKIKNSHFPFDDSYRAKVPGGWLVMVSGGSANASGLTFLPDPNQQWKATKSDRPQQVGALVEEHKS